MRRKMVYHYVIPILAGVWGLVATTTAVTIQEAYAAHTQAYVYGYDAGKQSGRLGTGMMDADPCSTDTNALHVVHFHGHLVISQEKTAKTDARASILQDGIQPAHKPWRIHISITAILAVARDLQTSRYKKYKVIMR